MKTAHFLRKDLTTSQDLSTGALSYTTTISRKFKLEKIMIHASVPITETITITHDSKTGTDYDTVLVKRSLVGEQDFVYRPTGEENFQDGDEVKIQCTQANLIGTVYVTIKSSEL